MATTYTCDGGSNPVPAMVTGNAEVQQSGNCTIANLRVNTIIKVDAGSISNVSVQDGTIQRTFDSLLANGYFGCVAAYATYAANPGGTLSLPGYCH